MVEASAVAAVRLCQITKKFGKVTAVDGVDLDVHDGEFFSMLGPSGSGKTTCLRLIAGFDQPTRGHIELHGEDVSGMAPFARNVNTVFQDYALFPHMTVADNVGYGLKVSKVGRAERGDRVHEALEMVRLTGLGDRRPAQLSGGQRQRVALARALVNRPRVLLLDEPLGALDLKLRHEMQIELKAIQREVGITFIYVTHDQEEALTMSDRLAVFNLGRIEQIGAPTTVYEHPQTAFVAGFVGTSNLLDGETARLLTGSTQPCSLRPERIRLLAPTDPVPEGHVSVTGHIRDVVFLGTSTRYLVAVETGADIVVVAQNNDGALPPTFAAPRQSVRISWSTDAPRHLATDRFETTPPQLEGTHT